MKSATALDKRNSAKKNKNQSALVEDVLNITRKPWIQPPTRTEPSQQISEFHLVKSNRGKEDVVHVNDLIKTLKKRGKQVEVAKKLNSAHHKIKTLPKPLEKPKAERIRRTIAYDNVKKRLDRWDAVVTSNRASDHLTFPLPEVKLTKEKHCIEYRIKSDLQKTLEALLPQEEVINLEEESKYPLTMQEMTERRQDLAKMRAVQSYKEAKARRQSKIKSKKYHRIQRKERIKQQMKEFELLQKTNPEEALKKLEEIEKVRALERASLRHRGTGKWAKSKQVQAKYDKESRQVLAQQLTLSRELTQKVKANDSDSELEAEAQTRPQSDTSKDNPWTNSNKTPNEVDEFISGYRKFWENKNKETKIKDKNEIAENTPIQSSIQHENSKEEKNVAKQNNSRVLKIIKKTAKKPKQTIYRLKAGTSNWDVAYVSSDESSSDNDENITRKSNDKQLKKSLKRKYEMLIKELKQEEITESLNQKIKKNKAQIKPNKNIPSLDLKVTPTHPLLKEALLESSNDLIQNDKDRLDILKALLRSDDDDDSINSNKKSSRNVTNIELNNIIKVKPVNLNTEIPYLLAVNLEDDEDNMEQNADMLEAFQDDDLVTEFKKDKQSEIDKEKPQDVDLSLPGWGSWVGPGIEPRKRTRSRFIMKFPKEPERRRENKGDVIINEKINDKLKSHLVTEVPFPFKTLKDFEASLRAPSSNTFIPETAYRRIIRPSVVTRLGTIIKPMTEDYLLKKKK